MVKVPSVIVAAQSRGGGRRIGASGGAGVAVVSAGVAVSAVVSAVSAESSSLPHAANTSDAAANTGMVRRNAWEGRM